MEKLFIHVMEYIIIAISLDPLAYLEIQNCRQE